MPQHTYTVVRTADSQVTGDPLWTVVEYVDGQPRGGDHHWVRERYAERAAAMYRVAPCLHGRPTSLLHALGLDFDPDPEA